MPHIVFGGRTFDIPEDGVDALKASLEKAALDKGPSIITATKDDGSSSWILWTPGAPIVINSWDAPHFIG